MFLKGSLKIPGKSRLLLNAALTTAVIAVSFAAIFIRLSEAPALIIALYRLLFTLGLLLPHSLILRWNELRSLKVSDFRGILISGFFLASHFYLWIDSLNHSPVIVAVILVSLHPLLVAVAGYFFLGDAVPRNFLSSMLLILAGTTAIASENISGLTNSTPTELRGVLMALGGAAMMAGYLLVGRRLRQHLSTSVYAGGAYGTAALILFITTVIVGIPLFGYSVREYTLFAALAIIPTFLGHTVFNWSLRKVRASLISLLYLGEPLGATVLAFIILQEVPTLLQTLGGVTILTGLYLVIKPEPTRVTAR